MAVLSKSYFHDEEAAFTLIESIIWNDEPSNRHGAPAATGETQ